MYIYIHTYLNIYTFILIYCALQIGVGGPLLLKAFCVCICFCISLYIYIHPNFLCELPISVGDPYTAVHYIISTLLYSIICIYIYIYMYKMSFAWGFVVAAMCQFPLGHCKKNRINGRGWGCSRPPHASRGVQDLVSQPQRFSRDDP